MSRFGGLKFETSFVLFLTVAKKIRVGDSN